jgi:hypothetical protein
MFSPPDNEGQPWGCSSSIPGIPSLITIRGDDGGVSALGTQFGMVEGTPMLKLRCEDGLERVVDPGDAERRLLVDHFDDGEVRSVGLMKAGKKDGLWVMWIDHATVDAATSGLYIDGERFGSVDPQVAPALMRHP